MKPVEVDMKALAEAEPSVVHDFEQTMWHEHAPEEPAMAMQAALWLATLERANSSTVRWAVRADGGGLMGVASLRLPLADNLHLGNVDVRVVPEHRRKGIGRGLLDAAVERARAEGRTTLVGFAWDIVPAGSAFASSAGATADHEVRRSDLDLGATDRDLVARWLDVAQEVRDRYELWTVVGAYPVDRYDAIAEVEEVMNTAPHDDLDVEDEVRDAAWIAERERQYAASPAERWTIFARERSTERLVGYTQVHFYDDWPGHVDQGNTGVHPDHRGHGLGRWLKAAMIDRIWRERPDSFRIRTTNAFSNAPMLAINDELGFVVTATSTGWQLAL